METINLHKYYYKDYFKLGQHEYDYIFDNNPKGDKSLVLRKNAKLVGNTFSDRIPNTNPIEYRTFEIPNECDKDEQSFLLTISYPGLVTGVGINHEAKIEGEFKLGVHFDFTYGMPVVYGSSVKGVLRAWFKEFYQPNASQPSVEDAFNDIFEGRDISEEEKINDGKKHYKSVYQRDIFFDAVITKADSKGRILCSDSITSHTAGPLKNPNPITFLKIAPGCTMEFRFKLVDSIVKDANGNEQIFTAAQKKALFEEIIKAVGVGAKTNVGYGQFQ